MKRKIFFTLALSALIFLVKAQILVPNDESSSVKFKIKNFGATVDGSFKGLQGKIYFDPNAITAPLFDVSVEASSVDTGIGIRDNHLRKKEYFDVKNYPRIRFVSTKVTPSSKPSEYRASLKTPFDLLL